MVHTETRPREAISFVRTGQRPSGDVNPSLFKTTDFICILKGDEVENEVGNRKEWARMGKLILKSKSCCPLASDLTRGTPFTPGLLQPYSSIFTKNHFIGRTVCREMRAGVCTWQSYIMYLMSK